MKIKTSELKDEALNWAVTKAIGEYKPVAVPEYSTDWAHGGPIIEREGISVEMQRDNLWVASIWTPQRHYVLSDSKPLVAAMRVYVASKLGTEVNIPEGI